jgi:cytochrome b involved in lipid metabolism
MMSYASLTDLREMLGAGKDATEDFEEIGHSNNARELLAKYEIGEYEVRIGNAGTWRAGKIDFAAEMN